MVRDYVNAQDGDFHLVFLVDEIGQYIGDNQQLILNLQTVVRISERSVAVRSG